MMVASEDLVHNAQSLTERDPIFGQILILYEKSVYGKQDNKLADFVLTQIRNAMQNEDRMNRFLEDRILEHHGATRKQYDELFAAMDSEDFSGSAEEFLEKHHDKFSFSSDLIYEMDAVEGSTYDLLSQVQRSIESPDFGSKIMALDALMSSFHAGVVPMELFDANADEVVDFAEFLKHASGLQLASLTHQMEGGFRRPSVMRVHSMFRRPVHVRLHRRRR